MKGPVAVLLSLSLLFSPPNFAIAKIINSSKIQYATARHTTKIVNEVFNGSTVLPLGDVQIWLHCAEIFDKDYTTLSAVLNDSTTIQCLIANNNACDYLIRNTDWINSMLNNQMGMHALGLSDYCAHKILEVSTWRNTICNSDYYKEILTTKVPVMTSRTEPYGECISEVPQVYNRIYWPFKGDGGGPYNGYAVSNPWWVGYVFPDATNIYVMEFGCVNNSYQIGGTAYFESSTNGTTWNILGSKTLTTSEARATESSPTKVIQTTVQTNCRYYRIRWASNNYTYGGYSVTPYLQFYGR